MRNHRHRVWRVRRQGILLLAHAMCSTVLLALLVRLLMLVFVVLFCFAFVYLLQAMHIHDWEKTLLMHGMRQETRPEKKMKA